MMGKFSRVTEAYRPYRRWSRAAGCAILLSLGACSVPDWADPTSYFEPDYGPAPKPVARAGGDVLPESQPAPQLASATDNVRRAGERPVVAVTRGSAAQPTAATPPLQPLQPDRAAVPETATESRTALIDARGETAAQAQRSASPIPLPRFENSETSAPTTQTAASEPVVQRTPVAAREPSAPPAAPARTQTAAARPAAAAPKPAAQPASGSPTPMIAAMTRGQQPPSFSENGSVVPRRTDVPTGEVDLYKPRTAASSSGETGQATPAPSRTSATASRSSTAAGQTAALANSRQPAPSRTYAEQLREAGIEPVQPTQPAPGRVQPGRVQPGTFPASVPQVVRQTYAESLNAPRTYDEAIGSYPSTGAGSGPVIISGDAVRQSAAYAAPSRAGSPDAVIQFRHGSTGLSSSDMSTLQRVAARAVQTNASVRVRGHSSSRTGQMAVERHLIANLKISSQRAENVADALARFGVPYERIFVEAKGDNEPVYNEAMPRGEAGNRRAEVFLEN
ncbi:MAG: OmpA family protein [Minwuia sp.]|uniref:OmpA family protein n=1 Tax=Minwuia sp. TaxID=2493630 RepID=UPI003A87937A